MNRYRHLDSLRGLAALSVLWMHGAEIFVRQSAPGFLSTAVFEWPNALKVGRVGIVIFFMLSGFLIARSLETRDWRRTFPIKRALRLYPAYLLSLVLALGLGLASFDAAQVAANLTMLPSFLGEEEILAIYWTLQTEVVFYALFYLALLLGYGETRRSLGVLSAGFTGVFIVSQLGLDVETLKSVPLMIEKLPQHLGIMFLGAYLYKIGRRDMLSLPALALVVLTVSPALFAFSEYAAAGFTETPPVMLSYLTAVAVAWAVFYFEPGSPDALVYLGKISYSLYLNHALVLAMYAQVGRHHGLLIDLAILFTLTIAVSHLTFRYVEAPAIRWSKRLTAAPALYDNRPR